ncbi:MAG: hypothetical protein KatS3mg110_1577 [Pirellulaceae bacterium]|nr:MAG: hypothetical protein KatS3mg110_1577 [Pirellulaceae bacterium]
MEFRRDAAFVGRGAQSNPTNRFERIAVEADEDHLPFEEVASQQRVRTEYFRGPNQVDRLGKR